MSHEPIQTDTAGNVTAFGAGRAERVQFLRRRAKTAEHEGRRDDARLHREIADRLEFLEAAVSASATIQKVFEFFRGLDAKDKERLAAIPISGFDEFVTSMPGPDFFDDTAKATVRPHAVVAINNGVNSLCGGA
jgi:hypothetical protein